MDTRIGQVGRQRLVSVPGRGVAGVQGLLRLERELLTERALHDGRPPRHPRSDLSKEHDEEEHGGRYHDGPDGVDPLPGSPVGVAAELP